MGGDLRQALVTALSLFLIAASLGVASQSFAKEGKLERFEKELDSKPAEKSPPKRHHDHHDYHDHDDDYYTDSASGTEIATSSAMSIFYNFFLMGLTTGAAESSKELYYDLKATGSPALPTIKFMPSYQFLIDKIHGAMGKVEFGYLTFGADAEYIRYFESDAPDLSIISGHFLLRTLFARVIGVDLALGAKTVWGANARTGFDFGFPFYVYFHRNFFLDVQPFFAVISGHRVYDMAGGLSCKFGAFGARIAYRAIHTGGETLQGPQAGIFIQW